MKRWLAVVAWLLIAGSGVVSQAAPANKVKAREVYRAGTQHYNLGEFQAALDAFKEAYRNYEEPTFLFNIAQCQRQLGQKQDAVLAYRAYLRESPNAPNRDEVQGLVANLERMLRDEQSSKMRPPGGILGPDPVATVTPRTTKPEPRPEPRIEPRPEPEPTVTTTTTTVVVVPVESRKTPVYKKWWLWTAIGAVVIVGVGVGVGVALGTKTTNFPSASTTDGSFRF